METSSQTEQSASEFIPTFLNKDYHFDYSTIGNNGFILQNFYIPEEILLHILSHVAPKDLLNYSLVCHNWNKLIKSNILWFTIYERQYNRKAKKLPWYLYYCLLATNYFDTNLLSNKDRVEEWNQCYQNVTPIIEAPKLDISAKKILILSIKARQTVQYRGWYGSRRRYYKQQWLITFGKNKLLRHILDVYKPHICLTKWGSMYQLEHGFLVKDEFSCAVCNCYWIHIFGEPLFRHWLDILITQYSDGVEGILLEQTCNNQDTSHAKKGIAKFLFDSIQLIDDKEINSKKVSGIKYIYEIHPVEGLAN